MRSWFKTSIVATALAAAAVSAVISVSVTRTSGQSAQSAASRARGRQTQLRRSLAGPQRGALGPAGARSRAGMVTQKGVYNYEYARVPAAPVLALGAAAGVPGSLGVVQGDGQIPYKPEAALIKQQNGENWIDRDPELKCYLPGIPRAMYMPYPFSITQGTDKIHMTYAFSNAGRVIHLNKVEGPPDDTFMGHSVGRWEGDTLVVEVTNFNGKNWFDRAGNFHSEALRLVERYSPISADAIRYEVTIEDPKVFARPWTIAMPLYRRLEPNATVLDYPCIEFAEEFMYGHLRKEQLVKRWEGETMIVDITRKIPPGDKLHEWYRR